MRASLDIELATGRHVLLAGAPASAGPIADALTSSTSAVRALLEASAGPPPAPHDLQVLDLDGSSATLLWRSVERAARYRVSRDGALLEPPVIGQCVYLDRTVRSGQTYRYAVAAEDVAGRLGAPSDAVEFKLGGAFAPSGPDYPLLPRPPGPEPNGPGYDPSWIPEPPGPFLLMEHEPFTIMELLEQRQQIMASVAKTSLMTPTTFYFGAERTYVAIPVRTGKAIDDFANPGVAKEISEFVGDLNAVGADVVFRIDI